MLKLRGLLPFASGVLVALLGGWVAFPRVLYTRIDQPIQFSHKTHTSEAAGLTCADCHALAEDGRFTGIPPIENCAGCHTEPLGKSAEEKKLIDAYVAKNRQIPWLVYARQPENAYFSHAQHVKLGGLTCERCHGAHGDSQSLRPLERNPLSTYSRDVEQNLKMNDCSRCHEERGVEQGCLTCHK